jgi:predicted DNA-binding transcriptional regulator YafY
MNDKAPKPFPNPEGQINVLKRYLHILALLQFTPEGKDVETWNATKLADLLSKDGEGKALDDSGIRKQIKKYIVKELGIDVDISTGRHAMSLAEDIDRETQLMIAKVYSGFVVKDATGDIILKKFVNSMPDKALWTLARIYFAIVEKRMIQFNYTTNTGYKINKWKLCPYYLMFRNNNLYLVVWDPVQKIHMPLLAERIKGLKVLEYNEKKVWDIIPVEELFKESLSAFITDYPAVEMKIRYKKKISITINGLLSFFDPEIKSIDNGDWLESTFNITDYLYLCQQLVIYGSDVEILSPPHVRKTMITMLESCLKVYKK